MAYQQKSLKLLTWLLQSSSKRCTYSPKSYLLPHRTFSHHSHRAIGLEPTSKQLLRGSRFEKCISVNSFHTSPRLRQEAVNNEEEEHEFQAETRMLLDIVARSLYSEKEVFVRELVSNASDAIEKARYMEIQGVELEKSEETMGIQIKTDMYGRTLVIQDSGIGMTRDEIINNLGIIAHSGSKAFLQELQGNASLESQNIIGQFGVGFYSAFMVADRVEVFTRSRLPCSPGYHWQSDGCGKYTLREVEGLRHGTEIVCHLRQDDRKFADDDTIKDIIKKYSNFVGCPIELNDTHVNIIEPLWLQDQKKVTEEQHNEFFRYIGGSYDKPRFILHYHTDAPIDLRCVLYFPRDKPSLFDLKLETDSGINLYCRRVLIKNKAKNLLPQWLRFVKGVVDSEDIPLNLSRELLQDSNLIKRLRTVIQNRAVRFLVDKSRKEPESYAEFYKDYGIFIKEGFLTASEQVEREDIAKLLTYETSAKPAGEMSTLPEYVSRMLDDQQNIYYLAAPSRELAENSPYYESLKKRNLEVLFCYEPYDETIFMQLRQYLNKDLVSAEKDMRQSKAKVEFSEDSILQRTEVNELMDWMKKILAGKCWTVKTTPSLDVHPCVITVEEMGSARQFIHTQFSKMSDEARYSLLQPQLEINPNHPIIVKVNKLRESNPHLAELVIKQLFNNGMVVAGLIQNPHAALTTMNELLELALEKH